MQESARNRRAQENIELAKPEKQFILKLKQQIT
jgi:hypothetical protein